MSCTGYTPTFGAGQLDGTQFAGLNCNCWCAGRACDDHTCGKEKPSSSQVRFWTGDISGGTNLAQVDDALKDHTGCNLDVRYRYPWSEFMRRINGGASAILQGWYAPIRDSRYSGSQTFGTNHSIWVPPGLAVMDPLADGRRPEIYKYKGEVYPEALLRKFAGKLNLSGNPDLYRPLGDGLCYAAFTRDNDAEYRVTIRPLDHDAFRKYVRYFLSATGRILGHETRRTQGFQIDASPPQLHVTKSGNARVSLVQLRKVGSPYDKWYVSSRWAEEV